MDVDERARRRLVRLNRLLVLGVAALVLMGQSTALRGDRVIGAERFVLRDGPGAARAELTVLPDGSPTLGFLDQTGKPRALLGLSPEGTPGLAVLDPDEQPRLTLGQRPDRTTAISAFAPGGQLRAKLDVGHDGLPGLIFFDRAGRAQSAFGVMPAGRLFSFPAGR